MAKKVKKKKEKINKDRFDEFGYRILGEDDLREGPTNPQPGWKGCELSNDANKSMTSTQPKKAEGKKKGK